MNINQYINLILCSIFFFAMQPNKIYAQQKDSLQVFNERSKLKHELAYNFRRFGFDNFFQSVNVMYKRGHKKKGFYSKDKIYNWRFALELEGQINFANQADSTGTKYDAVDDFQVRLGFGWERQKSLRKIIFYHGLDVSYNYFLGEQFRLGGYYYGSVYFSNESNDYLRTSFNLLSANPFMGLRYFISKRASIAIESSLAIGFFYSKSKNIDTDISTDSYGLYTDYTPLRALNLSFIF